MADVSMSSSDGDPEAGARSPLNGIEDLPVPEEEGAPPPYPEPPPYRAPSRDYIPRGSMEDVDQTTRQTMEPLLDKDDREKVLRERREQLQRARSRENMTYARSDGPERDVPGARGCTPPPEDIGATGLTVDIDPTLKNGDEMTALPSSRNNLNGTEPYVSIELSPMDDAVSTHDVTMETNREYAASAETNLGRAGSTKDLEIAAMAASLSSSEPPQAEPAHRETERRKGPCHRCGGPFPIIWDRLCGACCATSEAASEATKTRRQKIIVGCCVGALLFLLFIILFPISWDSVEFHQIALRRSRTTRKVYSDETYYPGCYVIGPDSEFVYMDGTLHTIDLSNLQITTNDRLQVTLSSSVNYMIRPEEAGLLFEKYEFEYDKVLRLISISELKNTVIQFSLDDLRLNRSGVEKEIHLAIFKKLSGDCCPKCCPLYCSDSCKVCDVLVTCNPGIHVHVRFFFLGALTIPDQVEERLMRRLLLIEEAQTEQFLQEYAVTVKKTDFDVQEIENEANEIIEAAYANSSKIVKVAEAEAAKIKDFATISGWSKLCDRFSLTEVDHKTSMLFIRTLNNMDNIYKSVDFDKRMSWATPPQK